MKRSKTLFAVLEQGIVQFLCIRRKRFVYYVSIQSDPAQTELYFLKKMINLNSTIKRCRRG